jgi:hypothetical protein
MRTMERDRTKCAFGPFIINLQEMVMQALLFNTAFSLSRWSEIVPCWISGLEHKVKVSSSQY